MVVNILLCVLFGALMTTIAAAELCNISQTTTNNVTISWSEPTAGSIVNYTVTCPGCSSQSSTTQLNYTVQGLDPGSTYTFTVSGQWTPSLNWSVLYNCSATTAAPQFNTTSSCTWSTWSNNSVNLSWPGVSAAYYNYSSIPPSTAGTAAGNTTSVNGLNPGTYYVFTVTANGRNNTGNSISCSGYTTAPTFPNTTNCVLSAWTINSVNLSWPNVSAAYYNYSMTLTLANTPVSTGTVDKTSVTVSLSSPGTQYTARVTANGRNVTGNTIICSGYTAPNIISTCTMKNYSTSSLDVTWTLATGAAYYVVYQNNSMLNNITTNVATASPLSPGTLYLFKVTAYGNIGQQGNTVSCTGITAPNITGVCTVSTATNNSLTATWSPAVGATFYTVTSNNSVVPSVTTVSSTFDVLKSGTLYQFTVTVFGVNGRRGNTVSCTGITAPFIPDSCSLWNWTMTSVSVTWSDVVGAASYDVAYYNNTQRVANTFTGTSCVRNGLTAGTQYTFNVTANGTRGLASNTVSCTGVTMCLLLNWTTTSVTIQWQHVESVNSYQIFYGDKSTNVAAPANMTTIENLEYGTEYVFVLQVVTTDKLVYNYTSCSGTTIPLVAECLLSDWTSSSVTINWPATVTNLQYTVTYNTQRFNLTDTTLQIDGLSPGTFYNFSVQAMTSGGIASGTVSCTGISAPVMNGTCNSAGWSNSSVVLSWSEAVTASATSYSISSRKMNSTVTATGNSVTVTNLLPGTRYEFDITAVVATGQTSNSIFCTSGQTDPDPPKLSSCESTPDTITLTLTPPDGSVDSYQLIPVCQLLPVDSNSGITCPPNITSTVLGHSFTGLTHNTNYTFNIFTITNWKHSYPLIVTCQTQIRPSTAKPPSSSSVAVGAAVGTIVPVAVIILIVVIVYLVFFRNSPSQGAKRRRDTVMSRLKSSKKAIQNPIFLTDKSADVVTSRPIKISEFLDTIEDMRETGNFTEQYEELRLVGRDQSTSVGDEQKLKNRYINIKPYNMCRVQLLHVEDEEGSDYINASWMPGFKSMREYIATQGPKNETIDDFWRMIWEYRCRAIVMLTKCVEGNKEKCCQYWPVDSESVMYGDTRVTVLSETVDELWTTRDLQINVGHDNRNLKHYHYTDWPDEGIPEKPESLVKFVKLVRETSGTTSVKSGTTSVNNGPLVIHCSAGVGRTGTFIAVDTLKYEVYEQDTVDVFGTVYRMRMNRCFMVQTAEQYTFIHDCVPCLIDEKNVGENDNIYENQTVVTEDTNHNNNEDETLYANQSELMTASQQSTVTVNINHADC